MYPPPPDLDALCRSLFGSPKPGAGRKSGGPPRPLPPEEQSSEPAAEGAATEPPAEEERVVAKNKPKAILRNLAWGAAKARFNEPVSLRLEADVPPEMAHLTRVEILVQALLPEGKRETIDKKEMHFQGGKASGTVTVYYPQGRDEDGNLLATCDFVFLAKHRESEEVESPRLPVTQPLITNVRWEKTEEWFGAPAKLLATTCLKDGEEATVKVASENGLALETKAKAKRGRLEVVWTPCLCGVAAGEDGKYPEKVEYYAEISKGEERAQPGKNFLLKVVGRTEYTTFSKDYSKGGYGSHAEFKQRIDRGAVDVHVEKTIMKAWPGYLLDMRMAGMKGGVAGCPYNGWRWGRITDNGELPTQYHDGKTWRPLPKGFRLDEDLVTIVGLIKQGNRFIEGGEPSAIWPEQFEEYDFDSEAYVAKRNAWKADTDSRWSRKYLIRPAPCSRGQEPGGCGYPLDLRFNMIRVETWQKHTIAVCNGEFRSNSGCFSMEDEDVNMAAHEVGHLIGMPDEYKCKGIDADVNGDGAVNGIDSTSIMGSSMDKVKKRHYANFATVTGIQVSEKLGRKIAFLAGDP